MALWHSVVAHLSTLCDHMKAWFKFYRGLPSQFVKVLNSWEHNEPPCITALKDKLKFQHGLVFFQERPKTTGTPVNDYDGNSFTAFRKESLNLLQDFLIFFNLRFSETGATIHFRLFQLNKIPRDNGRYGDTHIRHIGPSSKQFTTKFEPVYWKKETVILMHNILRERHIVFEDEDSELEQLLGVASVLPVSTKLGRADADSHKRAATRRDELPDYHLVMGTDWQFSF
ncbi:hypothetical protein RvY_07126 [Ramazzottius varieornatus]|uniref:Uncharacterized protein n=1 Tax=Ramazzottius varieornatus TaxID=947166 RepID=A0A1D1V0Z7_RAMVA|nr:hypothetical protein RvY_07126 [Ramazzottius varieornatus]